MLHLAREMVDRSAQGKSHSIDDDNVHTIEYNHDDGGELPSVTSPCSVVSKALGYWPNLETTGSRGILNVVIRLLHAK